MPISKNRKSHKEKSNNFKNKNKKHMNNQGPQQLPPVRNIPVWPSDAKIELTGFEWEAIQNGLVQVQVMQQAAQAIMSRNIINGVITMDFEKLNPKTLEYEPMTDEEKAPHREELAKLIEGLKNQATGSGVSSSPVVTDDIAPSPSKEEPQSEMMSEIPQIPTPEPERA